MDNTDLHAQLHLSSYLVQTSLWKPANIITQHLKAQSFPEGQILSMERQFLSVGASVSNSFISDFHHNMLSLSAFHVIWMHEAASVRTLQQMTLMFDSKHTTISLGKDCWLTDRWQRMWCNRHIEMQMCLNLMKVKGSIILCFHFVIKKKPSPKIFLNLFAVMKMRHWRLKHRSLVVKALMKCRSVELSLTRWPRTEICVVG